MVRPRYLHCVTVARWASRCNLARLGRRRLLAVPRLEISSVFLRQTINFIRTQLGRHAAAKITQTEWALPCTKIASTEQWGEQRPELVALYFDFCVVVFFGEALGGIGWHGRRLRFSQWPDPFNSSSLGP